MSDRAVLACTDNLEFLAALDAASIRLVVTSPPYNIGKTYERRMPLDTWLAGQAATIAQCVRLLAPGGSLCWQVGNHVQDGEIVPLDTLLYGEFKRHGLKLRNRIVWHFEHGLHCSHRLSGRYETINWFSRDDAHPFHLDSIRVPQKYPAKKHFKGPKAGARSGNPLGKNPGDVWIFPNVKSNHVEKTIHPCQFPVELVERLVLALTDPGDRVLDPFMGVGSTLVAAVRHGRIGLGCDLVPDYVAIARERLDQLAAGTLRTRPMDRPVYDPTLPGGGQRATVG
jgi:adenine-specific DNA-methyltransferase